MEAGGACVIFHSFFEVISFTRRKNQLSGGFFAVEPLSELFDVDLDAVAHALATPTIVYNVQPGLQGEVNCLGNIITSIKAGVVPGTARYDEFSGALNRPIQLDSLG